MPVNNAERFLECAVQSILDQAFKDSELIWEMSDPLMLRLRFLSILLQMILACVSSQSRIVVRALLALRVLKRPRRAALFD